MCGIAGFADHVQDHRALSNADGDLALVHAMCDVIRHRGPDDEGIHVETGVGLGMRRLSIIDLSTGHQPIHNEDRTVWTVFNGEIYNYRELREELEQAGHRFYTSSDTETIVHAYEQWGEQAFGRLRGMFGLAIWDRRRQTLLVARDRAGIKPVYFAERGGRLYFASEIKSLLVAGAADRNINLEALDHYLTFLYTPRDGSIFRGVRKLPPGHYLRWTGGHVHVKQYWQLPASETFAGTDADAADQLHAVLRDAVRSHLISDVPLGAFLSGGIDSSLVVGLMAEVSDRPVETFSIGFDEPQFDELDHARKVAAHFKTDHHEFVVRPDALAILDRLIQHFDEPFADSSAIPTWYVCEMARRHVTVVLSGDGGDELFGGYDRYLPHPRVAAFDRLPIPAKRQAAAVAWPFLPHGARGKNFLRHVARDDRGRFLDATAFFQPDEKRALYTDDLLRRLDPTAAEHTLAAQFEGLDALPFGSQMMKFDFRTYLPEDVLVKVDRMSMAHSIESRVPLLDNHVIDFAATLPLGTKIHNGVRKVLLKQVASRILPPDIINRRKQGFGVPVGVWFRGSLRETFGDVLRSQRARERGYFNQRFIDRLLAEHLSGVRDHSMRLWQLVVLELWHHAYIDTPTFVAQSAARPLVATHSEPASALIAHAH
jgi:asparagine synthase (glutamine-hydrolysing)